MKLLNNFLNSITMYRLMLYYLLALVVYSAILGFFNVIPYSGFDILINAVFLVTVCRFSNELLGKLFKAPTNIESSLITGLILSLIFGPGNFQSIWLTLTIAGISAMAAKYLLAWKGRHIFNPAAFGAVFVAVVLQQGASWWVGSLYMMPALFLGGLLILKKTSRFQLVGVFMISALIISFILNGSFSLGQLYPLIFFSTVMLIEPLTSAYKFKDQVIYGGLVPVLFNLYGLLSATIPLELALLTGNIYAYVINKSFRQALKLKGRINESGDVISFLFEGNKKINFEAGQYLEWTYVHPKPDSRGVRRSFTISSSPTENFVMLSTKFSEKSSTFKTALSDMKEGDAITVSNLQGEFTLPKDQNMKLCFIAGGIGITPFRSMAKYMLDNSQKRDVVLLYSNKTSEDIVFKDIFDLVSNLGWKIIYVNTDKDGYIDGKMIKQKVPDFKVRQFYTSGPEPMVEAFEEMLYKMGLNKRQVKKDYFPGYA